MTSRRRPSREQERADRFRPTKFHNPLARETIDPDILCGPKRKYTYPSKAKAKRAIAIVRKAVGNQQYPYQCRTCQLWHLTSTPPRDDRTNK